MNGSMKKKLQTLPKKICCPEQRAGWTSVCFLLIAFTGLALIAWWEYVTNNRLKTFDLDYEGSKYFGILADIHLDKDSNSTHCQNGSSLDGTWINHYPNDYGARFCDTSPALLDLTLSELQNAEKKTQQFEFLAILGDNSGHFTEGVDKSLEQLNDIHNLIIKYFPSTPVYFTLGNHDLSTSHSRMPNNPENWYKSLWNTMSPGFQKSEETILSAMKTFIYYGFYKIKHDDSLWVISLNTNMFMNGINVSKDLVSAQFSWLNKTLIEAHKLGSVSILLMGHISPDISFIEFFNWFSHKKMTWRTECIATFNQIVAPHWQIIKLQFYAHQHTNSWFVKEFPSHDYISYFKMPAVSMSDFGQPSFSVGVVNDNNWELLDLLYYFCPLEIFTRSNRVPSYSFQYSFKQQNVQYQEKYSVINGPLLKKITDRIIAFDDGMETYTNILMNVYQLSFKPHISPYGTYCVLTENDSDQLEACLKKYL